jgi:hypothetical protein
MNNIVQDQDAQDSVREAGPENAELANASVRHLSLWRAIVLGVLLIPLNVYFVTVIEVRWYSLDSTALPLFITPIFFLFLLCHLNFAWRKLSGMSRALRQEELLLIYIMLVMSCTFAGADTIQNLFGSIGAPYWYATKDNGWQRLFFQYLPKFLLIQDHDALGKLYRGGVNIYTPEGRHLLTYWLLPLAWWGTFFLTLFGMYLCINTLIKQAWIHNERLSFPIIQLPVAMTADDAGISFFRNKVMWAGFMASFLLTSLDGFHVLFPKVPMVQLSNYNIGAYFVTAPWNAIGITYTSFYPFAIGLAYFMPLDLSFSCWSFFVLSRIFCVAGSAFGYASQGGGFPYFPNQAVGAWLGLGAMLIFEGRRYWANIVVSAYKGKKANDPAEAIRYRFALIGLIVGIALLGGFAALIGMSWLAAVGFFGLVFLLAFVITRVRAEFGAPHEIYWVNPGQVLVDSFGTHSIGRQSLTLLSVLYWFNRCYRNHPMPNQLEAFKMMDGRKNVRFRGVIGAMCLAAFVSLLAVYWANLHITYAAGGLSQARGFKWWAGTESYNRLQTWLLQPGGTGVMETHYMIGGFLFVLILSILRLNIDFWPFHPAGYALAVSFAMDYFWVPMMIAWFAKLLILRYGGAKLYRSAVPFFLGLILGDYVAGSLWALAGSIMGVMTYKIFT